MIKELKNFFQKLIKEPKANFWFWILVTLILVGLIFGGWLIFFKSPSQPTQPSQPKQPTLDQLLFEAPIKQTLTPGTKAFLGEVQIEVFDKKEGEFKEPGAGQPIKKFLAIKIKVFNPSSQKTEEILIGLEDEFHNRYRLDNSLALEYFQNPDLKSFGTNMKIFPRTIQEGYVFFKNINESSQNYNLIFVSRSEPKRIIYKIQK